MWDLPLREGGGGDGLPDSTRDFGVFLPTGVNLEIAHPAQKFVKLVRDIKLGFSSFWTILANYSQYLAIITSLSFPELPPDSDFSDSSCR